MLRPIDRETQQLRTAEPGDVLFLVYKAGGRIGRDKMQQVTAIIVGLPGSAAGTTGQPGNLTAHMRSIARMAREAFGTGPGERGAIAVPHRFWGIQFNRALRTPGGTCMLTPALSKATSA